MRVSRQLPPKDNCPRIKKAISEQNYILIRFWFKYNGRSCGRDQRSLTCLSREVATRGILEKWRESATRGVQLLSTELFKVKNLFIIAMSDIL